MLTEIVLVSVVSTTLHASVQVSVSNVSVFSNVLLLVDCRRHGCELTWTTWQSSTAQLEQQRADSMRYAKCYEHEPRQQCIRYLEFPALIFSPSPEQP